MKKIQKKYEQKKRIPFTGFLPYNNDAFIMIFAEGWISNVELGIVYITCPDIQSLSVFFL